MSEFLYESLNKNLDLGLAQEYSTDFKLKGKKVLNMGASFLVTLTTPKGDRKIVVTVKLV